MIGILCGLKSEAKIADRLSGVLVGCSSARADRAQALVDYMIDEGAQRLISFGLAGATSPDLEAGDLFLGASVMAAQGAWEADTGWNDRLIERLSMPMSGAVWGSKRIVTSPKEKEAIYRRAGCMIVDMESHIVAEAAAQADIPFNIVRVVADTANMALPPAARVPLLDGGRVDIKGVLSSIFKQPEQMLDLFILGRNTAKALRTLKEVVAVMDLAR